MLDPSVVSPGSSWSATTAVVFGIFQFLRVWNDHLLGVVLAAAAQADRGCSRWRCRRCSARSRGVGTARGRSFIMMIVPAVVVLAMQRFFVRGLTVGSVKQRGSSMTGSDSAPTPFGVLS